MKPSTLKKIDKIVFMFLLSLNILCTVLSAIQANIHSALGWFVSVLWLLRCRHAENKLRETEIDLYVCVSFMEKKGMLGDQKKDGGK